MTEAYLNNLNFEDLLLEFKIMQALGYHSIFDANFRKEISNPLRRMLYYKLVIMSELQQRDFYTSTAKNISDRVGFYTDPELYHKVRNKEQEREIAQMSEDQFMDLDSKHKHVVEEYNKPTEDVLQQMTKMLETSKPRHSLGGVGK